MVDALNISEGEGGSIWFKLVPDDRKLWRGMEELV